MSNLKHYNVKTQRCQQSVSSDHELQRQLKKLFSGCPNSRTVVLEQGNKRTCENEVKFQVFKGQKSGKENNYFGGGFFF